ncbi:hypothetical protein JCM8547_000539 [Rhodosporidiobolus lusitaniae]
MPPKSSEASKVSKSSKRSAKPNTWRDRPTSSFDPLVCLLSKKNQLTEIFFFSRSASLLNLALDYFACGNTDAGFAKLLEARAATDGEPKMPGMSPQQSHSGLSGISREELSRLRKMSAALVQTQQDNDSERWTNALDHLEFARGLSTPAAGSATQGIVLSAADFEYTVPQLEPAARRGLGEPEDIVFSNTLLDSVPETDNGKLGRAYGLYQLNRLDDALEVVGKLQKMDCFDSLRTRLLLIVDIRQQIANASSAVEVVPLCNKLFSEVRDNRIIQAEALARAAENNFALKIYSGREGLRHSTDCTSSTPKARLRNNLDPALFILKTNARCEMYTLRERRLLADELQQAQERIEETRLAKRLAEKERLRQERAEQERLRKEKERLERERL